MKVKDINKNQRKSFKLSAVSSAIVLAMAAQFPANLAYANGAYGTNTDLSGATINVSTYYANSPQGIQPAFDLTTHAYSTTGATVDTGTPIRKFVDPLAGVDGTGASAITGAGIPLAIPEHSWVNPLTGQQTQDDYYEIAIVDFSQQMHSDLPKETRLRGYVQVETPGMVANGLKDVAGVASEHIPATYPDGTPIYKWKQDPVTGIWAKSTEQVYFAHKPHYDGPIITVARGTAVRIKYYNYLPYNDTTTAAGASVGNPNGQGGEVLIPMDEYTDGGGPAFDKNGNPVKYTENRADIHWHGGDTPWISDGTPHQWIAPAGEQLAYDLGIGRGASAKNVPDMADPGPGAGTLYFPNNLSARLMFYHDHTSGMTKINVYMGVAAGYVITDPVEQTLTGMNPNPVPGIAQNVIPNTLLGVGIPLIIQDKTFVPKNIGPNAVASDGTPQSQDAKWNLTHWGQPGDLWFPHVYEANQNPNSIDGTNPVGRWDWGPWFWPVFPAQYSLPTGDYGDVTATPEAFMDTPIVNGQAYPVLTVDPKAYRFRILSVPNDRSTNLSLFQAVDAAGKVCDATNTAPAPNATANGGTAPMATCTEVRMVPAAPTAGFPADWPTDGRAGGVPDPATAGPDIIQIGNEAGLLPAPAVWHAQPVSYDSNVRSMTIFNILKHGLLLGAAERADVVVDFSRYAGQTLILYNDAPAPMPGFDPRIDYYTNEGDQTGGGGSYNTPAGYGPNTRTIMQIKVNAGVNGTTTPAAPYNVAALAVAMPAAYAATQPAPIIPESAYNAPFGTASVDNYAHIYTGSATQPLFQYTVPPYTDANGVIQTTKTLPVINKAIQELFDPVYGRMNATLAVEMPYSSATIATTIPLNYVDTPIESIDAIKDGETQIWKITHNGVDSHPVHFHLVNVQVINRVDWAGVVKPPEANEVGWKETLRMNPLEDVYVAARAVHPIAPFGVPKSSRLLDPTQKPGSQMGFTQIDPTTGQAPATPYSNVVGDFDNEYVWHCHILGHEENDFMRPFIFHPNVVVPDAPAQVTVSGSTVSWIDPTPFGGQDAQGIPTAGTNAAYPTPTSSPKNEVGFNVYGANNALVATVPANTTSWTDTSGLLNLAGATVVAYNAAGNSVPGTSTTTTTAGAITTTGAVAAIASYAAPALTAAAAPTGLTQTVNADGSVTLSWVAVPGAIDYLVTVNGGTPVTVTGATTYVVPKSSLVPGTNNTFAVVAETPNGNTAAVTTNLYNAAAVAPVAFTASTGATAGVITLNWANSPLNVNNVSGLTLSWVNNGVPVSKTFAPTTTGATVIGLTSGASYNFLLQANSNVQNSGQVATVPAGTAAP